MRGTLRRSSIGLLAFLSLAVIGTALSWACSPGNKITVTSQVPAPVSGPPGSGPSGTEVTLDGENFLAGESVQIYWNELDGKLLATATVPANRSFTVKFDIPKAPADTHTILARTQNDGGQVFVGKAPFTVTEPGERATAPGQTAPGTTPGLGRGNTNGRADGGAGGGGRESTTVISPGQASPESNRAPQGGSSPGTGGTGGTVPDRSGAPVFAGSTAPADSPGASAAPASPRDGSADSPGGAGTGRGPASEVSAAGDLWGGFSSATEAPSLSGAARPAADTSNSMTIGLGLLGLGLVALFTGFGVADVRRRRRVAASAQGRSRQR